MYQFTKLTAKTQLFITQITSENKSKQLPVSIALSRLIAYQLPMPSNEVESIDNFFNTQLAVDVYGQVNQLNELLFLDVDAVIEYIRKFYAFRYSYMNPGLHLLIKPEQAVYDFFKITKCFCLETLKEIEQNGSYIAELTNRFIDLLNELKGG